MCPAWTTSSGVPRARHAASARGRALGRRRGRAPRAALPRPSARRRRPCRAHGRTRPRGRRRTRPRGARPRLHAVRRTASPRSRAVPPASPPGCSTPPSRRRSPRGTAPRSRPVAPRSRPSAGGSVAHVMPVSIGLVVRHEAVRQQLVGDPGPGRPADPPLDLLDPAPPRLRPRPLDVRLPDVEHPGVVRPGRVDEVVGDDSFVARPRQDVGAGVLGQLSGRRHLPDATALGSCRPSRGGTP